jgi:hypothetical protein
MRTQKLFFALALCIALGSSRIASAQDGGGHGIGLGAEQTLAGQTGATFVYDTGPFRFDVLFTFGFVGSPTTGGDDTTLFGIGGRFAYVIHRAGMADFSVGGGIGIEFASSGESAVDIGLEGFGQARIFLAPNFALHGSIGLGVVIADKPRIIAPVGTEGAGSGKSSFGIGGQLVAAFGFTYFFR